MEKAVKKTMTNSDHNELKELMQDDTSNGIPKTKRKKGPKTIIKEELVEMNGDPLGLHVSLTEEPKSSLDVKDTVRTKEDIVVERYNPEVNKGLTTEEVELRHMAGLANKTETGSTKSLSTIVTSNIVTFF